MSLFYWSTPPVTERTVAGDVVVSRMARWETQQDQIKYLREVVELFRGVAAIRARARHIVFHLDNCLPRNEVQHAISIGRWVQQNITYVKELPEVFQLPTTTIALGYGDCDDMCTVVASLCEAVGIETELVGLEWDSPPGAPGPKRAFQHIYAQAVIGGRWRAPLDTTLQRPMEYLSNPVHIGRDSGLRLRKFVAG